MKCAYQLTGGGSTNGAVAHGEGRPPRSQCSTVALLEAFFTLVFHRLAPAESGKVVAGLIPLLRRNP